MSFETTTGHPSMAIVVYLGGGGATSVNILSMTGSKLNAAFLNPDRDYVCCMNPNIRFTQSYHPKEEEDKQLVEWLLA